MLTKAENIAGYEKFTLDEVIYPDEKKEKEPEVGILKVRFFKKILDKSIWPKKLQKLPP